MSIRLLATGDLHIGKSVSEVNNKPGGFSAKNTWAQIVDWSIDNSVDIVTLSGDIVDWDNRYFEAVGPLQEGFSKLEQAGIHVYLVCGNHDFDVLPQLLRVGDFKNVFLLGAGGAWECRIFKKEEESLQLVGWSFPARHIYDDPLKDFNPRCIHDHDIPSIGLLHGEVDFPASNYAPLVSARFLNTPVKTWILGHIHKPQVISEGARYVCYTGSPLAFSPKETGIHSPLLFTVENGVVRNPKRVLTSPVRFEEISIDISQADTEVTLREIVIAGIKRSGTLIGSDFQGEGRIFSKVILTGLHPNLHQLKQWTDKLSEVEIQLDSYVSLCIREVIINAETAVSDLTTLAKQSSPAGILAQTILAIKQGEETESLSVLLKDWKNKYYELKRKSVYEPLPNDPDAGFDPITAGKEYLLKEAYRLLSMLINQKR